MRDCYSRERFILTLIPTALIVGGVLVSDAALDKGGEHNCGWLIFAGGWLMLALTLMTKINPDGYWKIHFTKENTYKALGAVTVMASAIFAQRALVKRDPAQIKSAMILFMLSWALFALLLGYDFEKGKFNRTKLLLAGTGAFFIVSSMAILTLKDRKYSVQAIQNEQFNTGNVFSFGLPLFTLGWVLIIMSISVINK
jgi:hypothetical protein